MASYKKAGQTSMPGFVPAWPEIAKVSDDVYVYGSTGVQYADMPIVLIEGGENLDVYDAYGYLLGEENFKKHVYANFSFEVPYGSDPMTNTTQYPVGMYKDDIKTVFELHPNPFYLNAGRTYGSDFWEFVDVPSRDDLADDHYHASMYCVYSYSRFGSIEGYLPANTTFRKPHGPLTSAEINEAIANAPPEKEINIQNISLGVTPPAGNTGLQGPSGLASTVNAVLPLVDMMPYMAMLDTKAAVEYGWSHTSNNFKYRAHYLYTQLKNKFRRPKGDYSLMFGRKKFNFKI
jgi:hypothetical protein